MNIIFLLAICFQLNAKGHNNIDVKVHERSEARARRKLPPPIHMHHWIFK
jgi:hypothetical protein